VILKKYLKLLSLQKLIVCSNFNPYVHMNMSSYLYFCFTQIYTLLEKTTTHTHTHTQLFMFIIKDSTLCSIELSLIIIWMQLVVLHVCPTDFSPSTFELSPIIMNVVLCPIIIFLSIHVLTTELYVQAGGGGVCGPGEWCCDGRQTGRRTHQHRRPRAGRPALGHKATRRLELPVFSLLLA